VTFFCGVMGVVNYKLFCLVNQQFVLMWNLNLVLILFFLFPFLLHFFCDSILVTS